MSRKRFSASEFSVGPRCSGVGGRRQPPLCQPREPAPEPSPPQGPSSESPRVCSQQLPRSPFRRSPGLPPSALPSSALQAVRKGGAVGEERRGAPGWGGCRWAGPGRPPAQTGASALPSGHKGLGMRDTPAPCASGRLTFPDRGGGRSQTWRLKPAGQATPAPAVGSW